MRAARSHIALVTFNLAMVAGFGCLFAARQNHEFVTYSVVVGAIVVAVGLSLGRVQYTLDCLVALTVWAIIHLAGGAIPVGESGRLYDVVVVPLNQHYPALRYDQIVHIWGFGSATLFASCLLDAKLRRPVNGKLGLVLVLVAAGLGFGAFNEIVEFIVSETVSESHVGGYTNTALDLCANFVGAILAVTYLGVRGRLS
ncbi:MAG: DUF2238 domain-containing protein [Planctomycetota bacterium]|jgi:putative membrane protein